jgi:nucleoside-diphosphate-sugar epimerase
MKVVVTGATGFLGSYLVKHLQKSDHEVIAIGRDIRIGDQLEQSGIRFIPADLSSQDLPQKLPPQIDWVVHCAALSSPWGRPEEFYRSNVLATKNLVQYAQNSHCKRFVHISSPSIYVDRVDKLNVRESDPLPKLSLNHYIATKRQAEVIVDQAVESGLSAITLRPQGIVGRGDRSIFPRILKIAKRGFVPRIGSGQTLTDLTHVNNVVDAIMCALNANDQLSGQKYNITNGEPIDLYRVIEELMSELQISFKWKKMSLKKAYYIGSALEWTSRNLLFHKEPLLTRYTACALGASRTLNIDKARAELNYAPRFSLNDALKDVIKQMQEGKSVHS